MSNTTRDNPTPTIYLIRHGETTWSLSGQHTGRTDLALTPHGEDQARALSPVLERITFSHVMTSPLRRARQTCQLAGLAEVAIVEPDLIEWDYGEYEGLRSADIRKQRPDWSIFRDGCPGGETADQIARRADRMIARLAGLAGNIALFGHGQFGRSLAVRWIDLALVNAGRLTLDTASLGILGHDGHHSDTRVIALWNFVPSGNVAHRAQAYPTQA
ncbi:MAG: histidine phosphatase family protein [Sphingomonas sp. 28-66-16]|nr:MAG: histidine phosphatase family protein [Sphingomonas sp. 28-66-16]